MNSSKAYEVKLILGKKTTTYDLEGEVVSEKDVSHIKEEEAMDVVLSFIGEIDQIPPMYSALKKNGVRLYDLQGRE